MLITSDDAAPASTKHCPTAEIVPYLIPDEVWEALAPHLPAGQPGKPRVDDRRIISGIVYVLNARCRWQDTPPAYGPYTTIYNRYYRWTQRGVWRRIRTRALASNPIHAPLSEVLQTILDRKEAGRNS